MTSSSVSLPPLRKPLRMSNRLQVPAVLVVVVLGVLAGFAGVAFLASPSGGASLALVPALVVLGGSMSWAAAALYGSRAAISRRPLLATSIQLLAGGTVQTLLGLGLGEAG